MADSGSTTLRDAALRIAERGRSIFPCKPRGKIPLTEHGCKDATTDAKQITAWWREFPEANIGLATGKLSGLWVVDVDQEDGEKSLREIEEKHKAALPPTFELITGRGRHLYFRLPANGSPEIKNSAGQLGVGIDVRGSGGYVICPPSVHETGRRYTKSVDSADKVIEAPVWLINLVAPQTSESERHPPEHWRTICKGVKDGVRNVTCASLAGYLLRLGMRPDVATEIMRCWNLCNTPPLADEKIVSTVESIAKREMARRGIIR